MVVSMTIIMITTKIATHSHMCMLVLLSLLSSRILFLQMSEKQTPWCFCVCLPCSSWSLHACTHGAIQSTHRHSKQEPPQCLYNPLVLVVQCMWQCMPQSVLSTSYCDSLLCLPLCCMPTHRLDCCGTKRMSAVGGADKHAVWYVRSGVCDVRHTCHVCRCAQRR